MSDQLNQENLSIVSAISFLALSVNKESRCGFFQSQSRGFACICHLRSHLLSFFLTLLLSFTCLWFCADPITGASDPASSILRLIHTTFVITLDIQVDNIAYLLVLLSFESRFAPSPPPGQTSSIDTRTSLSAAYVTWFQRWPSTHLAQESIHLKL